MVKEAVEAEGEGRDGEGPVLVFEIGLLGQTVAGLRHFLEEPIGQIDIRGIVTPFPFFAEMGKVVTIKAVVTGIVDQDVRRLKGQDHFVVGLRDRPDKLGGEKALGFAKSLEEKFAGAVLLLLEEVGGDAFAPLLGRIKRAFIWEDGERRLIKLLEGVPFFLDRGRKFLEASLDEAEDEINRLVLVG